MAEAAAGSCADDAPACRKKSIAGALDEARRRGRGAFIPFLVAGDPSAATTLAALQLLDEAGADVVEVGVPIADPRADGPTIQAADARALQHGATLETALGVMRQAVATMRAPILLFAYFSLVVAEGVDNFCSQAQASGTSGLLVPDCPAEQEQALSRAAAAQGLEHVLLVGPAMPPKRMQQAVQTTKGFLYLASVAGVTGARHSLDPAVEGLVRQLRCWNPDTRICVGFGVSTPEQARQLLHGAPTASSAAVRWSVPWERRPPPKRACGGWRCWLAACGRRYEG